MSSVEARSYISFSSQTFLDFHPTLVHLSCLAVKVRVRDSRTIQTLAKKTNLGKRHERRDWLLFIFRRLKLRFLWLKWSTIGLQMKRAQVRILLTTLISLLLLSSKASLVSRQLRGKLNVLGSGAPVVQR